MVMKWREEGEVRMMRAISTLTSWMRYHSVAGRRAPRGRVSCAESGFLVLLVTSLGQHVCLAGWPDRVETMRGWM